MSVLTLILKPRVYFENTDIYPNCSYLRLQLLILSKIKCTYKCLFLFSINSDIINHHQLIINKCLNIDNMSTILKCSRLGAYNCTTSFVLWVESIDVLLQSTSLTKYSLRNLKGVYPEPADSLFYSNSQ